MRPYSFLSFVFCTTASATKFLPLRRNRLAFPVVESTSATIRSKSKRQRCTFFVFAAFLLFLTFL